MWAAGLAGASKLIVEPGPPKGNVTVVRSEKNMFVFCEMPGVNAKTELRMIKNPPMANAVIKASWGDLFLVALRIILFRPSSNSAYATIAI